jgi:hypothetical protein
MVHTSSNPSRRRTGYEVSGAACVTSAGCRGRRRSLSAHGQVRGRGPDRVPSSPLRSRSGTHHGPTVLLAHVSACVVRWTRLGRRADRASGSRGRRTGGARVGPRSFERHRFPRDEQTESGPPALDWAPRLLSAGSQAGMPGGPRMSMPHSAAAATSGAGSEGGAAGSGIVSVGAGWPHRAHEVLEAGGLGDEEVAGLR